MKFLDKLMGKQPAPAKPEPTKYHIPDDKIDELARLWDERFGLPASHPACLARVRLGRYVASIFPDLDMKKGSWRINWGNATEAWLYKTKED